jgi:hypothetical protein
VPCDRALVTIYKQSNTRITELTWRYVRMELSYEPCPSARLYRTGSQGEAPRHRFDTRLTERSVFRMVDDLTLGGYVVKEREGRRNRYLWVPRSVIRRRKLRVCIREEDHRALRFSVIGPGPERQLARLRVVADWSTKALLVRSVPGRSDRRFELSGRWRSS